MEIAVQPLGNAVEVKVKGRLDNNWSEFFAANLARIVADGTHDLRVDLSEVSFLSSAGIGVLVRCYNQLHGIAGSFAVVRSSARVSAVLKQTALEAVLCSGTRDAAKQDPASALPRTVETDRAAFDLYDLPTTAGLRCRTLGEPESLLRSGLQKRTCYALGPRRFAVGVGALGSDFEDCRERFGEFIAVEDATAYQPTERASPADYLVCDGGIAEAQMLYGLAFDGGFQQLIRFESRKESGPLPLSYLVQQCLELNGAALAGIVVIAEVAGMVGAALRRSPTLEREPRGPLGSVSDWLSFSPDRSLQRTVAVAAGLALFDTRPEVAPFVRPMSAAQELVGHFHAAAFSYQPLQRGFLELQAAVKHVFESQSLLSVLHLLNDARVGVGIGESEFVRGACWVSAVSDIAPEAA